jgi:hypothetical protein
MQSLLEALGTLETESGPQLPDPLPVEPVSTHVLVPEDQVLRLRELSARTRVAQSDYLREAVDDLLTKYGALLREAK